MMHKLWCRTLDCHNLVLVILHLQLQWNIYLARDVITCIATSLKLPELNILARKRTAYIEMYTFWDTSKPPCELYNTGYPKASWVIAFHLNSQLLALGSSPPPEIDRQSPTVTIVRHGKMQVFSKHHHQEIANVERRACGAFSVEGAKFAVSTFVSGKICITIYDVMNNAYTLLANPCVIFLPEVPRLLHITHLNFSPTGATLAVAWDSQICFMNVFDNSCITHHWIFPLRVTFIEYIPNGSFAVATGFHLDPESDNDMDGFIHLLSTDLKTWSTLFRDSTGRRFAVIDTLAFASCSTKVACFERGAVEIYMLGIESPQMHRMTMRHSVDAAGFDASGQRLVTAHRSCICIVNSISGATLHEVPFFDPCLRLLGIAWSADAELNN